MFAHFKDYYGSHKNILRVYMILGDAVSKLETFVDFKPYFKIHNLVSVHPKGTILSQMTNLNMIFHVVVSVHRLVKIGNSPQFHDEFRNGQFGRREKQTTTAKPETFFYSRTELEPTLIFSVNVGREKLMLYLEILQHYYTKIIFKI